MGIVEVQVTNGRKTRRREGGAGDWPGEWQQLDGHGGGNIHCGGKANRIMQALRRVEYKLRHKAELGFRTDGGVPCCSIPKPMVNCIIEAMEHMQYYCDHWFWHWRTDAPSSFVEWFGTCTIHLFFDRITSDQHLQECLVHELSHACGTRDRWYSEKEPWFWFNAHEYEACVKPLPWERSSG